MQRRSLNAMAISVLLLLPALLPAQRHYTWTLDQPATEAYITGGPWTLEQSDASEAARAAGYCVPAGVNGVVQTNPGTERMQPYYFPHVIGYGKNLQGYFDYRPRNIDEATVAASSTDGGRTWTFQQEVLELATTLSVPAPLFPSFPCPPSDKDDLGNDNGLGHPFTMTIKGVTYLYNLDRRDGHIDSDGLVVTTLSPQPGQPLNPAPAADPGGDDLVSPGKIENSGVYTNTVGLMNPDAVMGEIPGTFPRKILYVQKQLNADSSFPANQLCGNSGLNPGTNDDITTVRVAQTSDGINFTDLGPVSGLNDPTTISPTGTRWIGSGALIGLDGGRYGMFFSGGNCIDADSDAFHYLGYAESDDLFHWTVFNDITHPIVSVATVTIGGATVPSTPPVIGNTQGWFAGRVYAPNIILNNNEDNRSVTVIFAGYHTPKPKNDLGDYRTIGWVSITPSRRVHWTSNNPNLDDE